MEINSTLTAADGVTPPTALINQVSVKLLETEYLYVYTCLVSCFSSIQNS